MTTMTETNTRTETNTKTTWQIDATHTGVELAVKHMMFTTVRGRFKDVKGTIEVDEQNPANSTVNVEIAAASLDTGVADRDGHLRSPTFSMSRITPPSPSAASGWREASGTRATASGSPATSPSAG